MDRGDEEAAKFNTGRDSEELGVVDLRLPGAVPGVEEVAGVEVVASVCSAEPEELHGGVSTTAAPVCCRWIQKRKKGNWERRRMAAVQERKRNPRARLGLLGAFL